MIAATQLLSYRGIGHIELFTEDIHDYLTWFHDLLLACLLVDTLFGDFVVLRDTSDNFFTIGVDGTVYFVNDTFLENDFFSTNTGDNANSGTTPDDPMKSVNAVLSAYDLAPGSSSTTSSRFEVLSHASRAWPNSCSITRKRARSVAARS